MQHAGADDCTSREAPFAALFAVNKVTKNTAQWVTAAAGRLAGVNIRLVTDL